MSSADSQHSTAIYLLNGASDEYWIDSEAYTAETINVLRDHYSKKGQRPHFWPRDLESRSGYFVEGATVPGPYSVSPDDEPQQWQGQSTSHPASAKHTKTPNLPRRLHSMVASSLEGAKSRVSWLSALSDQLRPHSQFSYSSDKLRLRLEGQLQSLLRSSDGSWRQHLHLLPFRTSKASDELHHWLPAMQSCAGTQFDSPLHEPRRASCPTTRSFAKLANGQLRALSMTGAGMKMN